MNKRHQVLFLSRDDLLQELLTRLTCQSVTVPLCPQLEDVGDILVTKSLSLGERSEAPSVHWPRLHPALVKQECHTVLVTLRSSQVKRSPPVIVTCLYLFYVHCSFILIIWGMDTTTSEILKEQTSKIMNVYGELIAYRSLNIIVIYGIQSLAIAQTNGRLRQ